MHVENISKLLTLCPDRGIILSCLSVCLSVCLFLFVVAFMPTDRRKNIVFVLSICLFLCLSVVNFNIRYNF